MDLGDRRSERRVGFELGIHVYIMGIDGTWRRECRMVDASQNGARLIVDGSIEGLDLKEFFLLLSSTGLAFRRCRMLRVAGEQIRVEFLVPDKAASKKKTSKRAVN
jgi:PilZ domain